MASLAITEERVAAAARAWRAVSQEWDDTARGPAEGRLADELESWIAELLASNPRWELKGRWFDGLQILECVADESEGFRIGGYIWRIDTQQRYPFKADMTLSHESIATFEVLVATREAKRPDWAFRFDRKAAPSS